MAEAFEQLRAIGRRAWPEVTLDDDKLRAHAAARQPVDEQFGADLYLACACADGNERALAAFEARYLVDVPLFLAGVERAESVVEEVKQLVRERLFVAAPGERPKILDYAGRGPLKSWLRVVTLRVAANRRRVRDEQHRPLGDEADATATLPAVDPELAIIKTRYKGEFNGALREAFAELSSKERMLFRMHFVEGLNIDRIGVIYKVHRATVARWIAEARERLLARTMALLGERLALAPDDFASLLRVVRSSLHLSLHALLAEPSPRD